MTIGRSVSVRCVIARLVPGAVALGVGFGALVLGSEAKAASITHSYQGSVTSVDMPLDSQFSGGQTFTFSYTYEDTTVDTETLNAALGRYTGAVTSYSATVGSYTATGSTGDISVFNNSGGQDAYNVAGKNAAGAQVLGEFDVFEANLFFSDPDQTAFENDLLPTVPPDPSLFTITRLELIFLSGEDQFRVIAENNVSAVPLPAALPLFASALAGFGFFG